LYSKDVADVLHALYRDLPNNDNPALRHLLILSIFAVASPPLDAHPPLNASSNEIKRIEDARTLALQAMSDKLNELNLLPLTKLDFMVVLESRITQSDKPVYRYINHYRKDLNITDTDLLAMFESAAIAALPVSTKVEYFIRSMRPFDSKLTLALGQDAQKSG
jgi:hypothetical protein